MQYKRLTHEDIEALKALRTVYAAAFDEAERYAQVPSDEYLEKTLRNEHCVQLVALSDTGEVVGGLTAYLLPKIDSEHAEVYLYDLAVAETHRRQGIATSLITELKRIGRTLGASVIFVQADNVDAAAVALYTKLASSIESDITHFDISIEN